MTDPTTPAELGAWDDLLAVMLAKTRRPPPTDPPEPLERPRKRPSSPPRARDALAATVTVPRHAWPKAHDELVNGDHQHHAHVGDDGRGVIVNTTHTGATALRRYTKETTP